ncbi:hypothetical protein RB195_008617 [Necator americanus]|uniref:Uncharacterized protein n=1 Tax=Necator americanus TaxID=51031 RepID=A0ABR1CPH1_NECAM
MSSTNVDQPTSLKIEAPPQLASDIQYSFFWDRNLPDPCCTSELRMELQTTVALPDQSFSLADDETQTSETSSNDLRTEENPEQESNLSTMSSEGTSEVEEVQSIQCDFHPCTSTAVDDTSIKYEFNDEIYKPTVISTDASAYETVMQRRMQRRQIRRAEEFLRTSVLLAKNNDVCDEFATPARQSTQYCDIDANDDATLWMLLQLSAKKLRGQTWPCRNQSRRKSL